MIVRKNIELNLFKKGQLAYLTRGFSTYNVRYIGMDKNGKVVVEVVDQVAIHKSAMKRYGFKTYIKYNQGDKLKVYPEKLWTVETIGLFQRLVQTFRLF